MNEYGKMILANSSTLVSLLSPIVTAAIFVVGAIAAWITFRLRKRSQSGNIQTSEASDLWKQTQAMLSNSQEARINAEHQRDALLASQSSIVGPALTNMNDALRQMSTMLTAILDNQQKEGKV